MTTSVYRKAYVDERDRRLHNARAAHAESAHHAHDGFWARIRDATDQPHQGPR